MTNDFANVATVKGPKPVEVLHRAGCLIVHAKLDSEGYAITHEPSGRGLGQVFYNQDDLNTIKTIADNLSDLPEWGLIADISFGANGSRYALQAVGSAIKNRISQQ